MKIGSNPERLSWRAFEVLTEIVLRANGRQESITPASFGRKPGDIRDVLHTLVDRGLIAVEASDGSLWATSKGLQYARERAKNWHYDENPNLVIMSNPPTRGKVFGKQVVELRYIHAEDGKPYKHPFGKGTKVEALPDGSVRIYHPKHRVWGDY